MRLLTVPPLVALLFAASASGEEGRAADTGDASVRTTGWHPTEPWQGCGHNPTEADVAGTPESLRSLSRFPDMPLLHPQPRLVSWVDPSPRPASGHQELDRWIAGSRAAAQDFAGTFDPWVTPLAMVKGKPECINDDCPYRETCAPVPGARCVLTNCGDGVCPACPGIFDLNKLAVKGWCSYTCTSKGQIVAIKVRVRLKLFGSLSECLPLEKPTPCEGECM